MATSEIAYGRTALGQAVYDVYMSRMSAAEVARRHHLSREWVLDQRHWWNVFSCEARPDAPAVDLRERRKRLDRNKRRRAKKAKVKRG